MADPIVELEQLICEHFAATKEVTANSLARALAPHVEMNWTHVGWLTDDAFSVEKARPDSQAVFVREPSVVQGAAEMHMTLTIGEDC